VPFDDHDAEVDPGPVLPEGQPGAWTLPKDEREYIIPAQDAKGHNVRLYCRAMPSVGRLVADVHASKKYPFRTMGDIIRWCVVNGAKRLAAGKGVPSVIAQVDAMIAVLQEDEFQLQFMEFFNLQRRVVDHYLEAKAAGEARRVVARSRAQIEAMEDGYWKTRYKEELLHRFGKLLDDGQTGSWDHGSGVLQTDDDDR
jgi:hypothetical protein